MASNKHRSQSRRKFLRDVAMVAVGGTIAEVASQGTILDSMANLIDEAYQTPNERIQTFDDIFGSLAEYSIDEGIDHPSLGGIYHEDNTITAAGLLNHHPNPDQLARATKVHSKLPDINSNVIAIGSWKSTHLSQWQFGDENTPERMPNAEKLNQAIRWKVDYDVDVDSQSKRYLMANLKSLPEQVMALNLLGGQPFSHYDNQRDEWVSTNRPIIDKNLNSRAYPVTDEEDDYLERDYLVISLLPNVMSKEAYQSGKKFLQFAGCHGTGTRAVLKLMTNEDEFENLRDRAEDVKYFQAIFRVDVTHEHQQRRTLVDNIATAKSIFSGQDEWFEEIDVSFGLP